ncbi:AAA family ATPase [Cobetia sp. MMG027]|uniref:AAA family ATPase n=1 Tax=Cobetia sp. MMG027 TaxID=3021980 RepID=UPI0022FE300E|nr:AAA family ATPase [Cobetia sp. MMG027]MDA5564626.1 AAA family ATPase [Cobetia sp. MMG027]
MIKNFYIDNLFNEKDVNIDFPEQYKILVSENGCGKTTILNAFYSLVSGDLSRLRKIEFDNIGIVFDDDDIIWFTKEEINSINKRVYNFAKRMLGDNLSESRLHSLLDTVVNTDNGYSYNSSLIRDTSSEINVSASRIHRTIKHIMEMDEYDFDIGAQKKISQIKAKLDYDVLYLPTYRRVERLVDGITVHDQNEGMNLQINFGMADVEESIERITSEIKTSSIESFYKLNGQMLAQLVGDSSVTEDMKLNVINSPEIKIVLDRLSESIPLNHKNTILGLIDSHEILNSHDTLVYLLNELLKVYKQQADNDAAIRDFSDSCNNYLNGKKIIYDESTVTVKVVRNKNRSEVNLEDLSSGEKQILSIFSLLYLSRKNKLAIFFDEPELSLSIEWQKTLLPDILSSGKCAFLLATTHSPFIFANELKNNTVDLLHYVKEL